MDAREKAKELFNKMYFSEDQDGFHSMNKYRAKECALIAVDEIIDLLWHTHRNETEYRYWQEVKQEIEKL
jgi:hypothetical protein